MTKPKHIVKGLVLLGAVMLTSLPSHAELRVVSFTPGRNVNFADWTGVGDRVVTLSLCLRSRDNTGTASNYTMTMQGPLELAGKPDDLPFSGLATDLVTTTSSTIIADQATTPLTGDTGNCASGDNLELEFTITETDMKRVEADRYRTIFDLDFVNDNGDNHRVKIHLTIWVEPFIQLAGMQDLYLGIFYPGGGDIQRTIPLCVSTNIDRYEVTASGNGAGSAFTLQNSATDTVPYSVRWEDSGGWTTLNTTKTSGAQDAGARCLSSDDNSQLEITVLSADMEAATSSTRYTGTITILVAPR